MDAASGTPQQRNPRQCFPTIPRPTPGQGPISTPILDPDKGAVLRAD
jgi:hypothetical protein